MKRRSHARSRPECRRPLRLEMLEQRIVFDAALGNTAEVSPLGPFDSQRIQSEDELRQLLLDNATQKWDSLFDTETRGVATFIPGFDNLPEAVRDLEYLKRFGRNSPSETDLTWGVRTDEHVLAQTDGEYLYVVSELNKLTILDVRDPQDIKLAASLGLEGNVREIYVSGDRLIAIAGQSAGTLDGTTTNAFIPYWDPRQTVTVYDVANPAEPKFVSRSIVEGNLIDSSLEDDSITLVMSSYIMAPHPVANCSTEQNPDANDSSGSIGPNGWSFSDLILPLITKCRYESKESYVARVSASIIDDTLPFTLTELEDGSVTRRHLVLPEDIYVDGEPLNHLVSTVSFDIDAGVTESAGVFTGFVGQAYLAEEHVYVATPEGSEVGAERTTLIHQFTIGDEVTLTASTRVEGRVINPFALNEFEGHLRVATAQGRGDESSQNLLILDANTLAEVGSLQGLGQGLYVGGVHFLDDRAFFISFASAEDDFSVDLSDPANPVIGGNLDLSIPSSVLIPIDGGYLVDVGRDVDLTNGIELRPSVSLLNVQDLGSPELVDREKVGFEGRNWAAALAGRDAVEYFSDHDLLAVAFAGYELGGFVDALPENVVSLGRRVLDSFKPGTTISPERINELIDQLPGEIKSLLKQFVGEIPSPEKIRDLIAKLPQNLRDILERGIGKLPAEIRATIERLLAEAENGGGRVEVRSGLSLFTIDPSAENPIARIGTISHQKSIRQSLVIGDVLFAISADTVTAHDVDHPEQKIDEYYSGRIAFDDTRLVEVENGPAVLTVLENDRVPDTAKIIHVSNPTLGGKVTISEDGRSILYTAPTGGLNAGSAENENGRPHIDANGRVNADQFEYTVALENGTRGSAHVTVNLAREQSRARMVRLAIADLAKRLDISPERIEVSRVESRRWPDGCLGIRHRDVMCTMAIVPGYEIWLSAQGNRYEYHTDTHQTVVLVERPRDPEPDGVLPDTFRVFQDSGETKLDVLANDFRGIHFIKAPQISAVSASRAGGTVKIGENGFHVLYTPPANFVGEDHFTYTVDGGPVGEVTVHVVGRDRPDEPPDGDQRKLIDLDLEITNEAGQPLRSIELGQTFYVNVYVDDLRREGTGVFGAYFDLEFDPALAQVVGEIEYNSIYPNGKSGAITDGLIDELGAFTDSVPALGDGQQLLLRIEFEALAEGTLKLLASPADDRPAHEMLLFGRNSAVPTEQVQYGDAGLAIANGYHNEAEPSDVNGDASVTPLDALNVINVINESGAGEVRATMRNYFRNEVHAAAKAIRMYYDVNRDSFLTALDPLVVINRLNSDARKAVERLQVERTENAAGDDLNNGRGDPILPPDLGQRDDSRDQDDENGRPRSSSNTPDSNPNNDVQRPDDQRANTDANGRGEGEASDDDSLADVIHELCMHHSSNEVDNFFASWGTN